MKMEGRDVKDEGKEDDANLIRWQEKIQRMERRRVKRSEQECGVCER